MRVDLFGSSRSTARPFAITSSSPSQSCGPYGRFMPLARQSLLLDSRLRAPSPPRRCGPFDWRARPLRAWPAFAPASRAPIRHPRSRVRAHDAEPQQHPRRVGSECICRHVCWFAPAAPCRRRNSGAASCRARPPMAGTASFPNGAANESHRYLAALRHYARLGGNEGEPTP
jgi:hypothetical protein